tara:strand:+ start:49 stop:210 length:162 start_codon:yes stop_codon:yes gene_type:complete
MNIVQKELPLNHEPSLDHWAKVLADCDVANGNCLNWDHAYESHWELLDAEFKS